jgi:RNA polymerase sigma-70 factor, ECF subfamily
LGSSLPIDFESLILATEQELNAFLKEAERRAFKRSMYLVRDEDAALDIVQDSMIKLAQHYGTKPVQELPMLFQRILSNCTMDWFRQRKSHNKLFTNMSEFDRAGEDEEFDLLSVIESIDRSDGTESAYDSVQRKEILATIENLLQELPARQREAFLMRYWEDLNVTETASAMGCTEGSVKTHCFRATQALAKALSAKGIRP